MMGNGIADAAAYAAAVDELGRLAVADPGTPAGRRFEELVRLIEEYDALRGGYALLPRARRALYARNAAARATAAATTEASRSAAPDSPAPAA